MNTGNELVLYIKREREREWGGEGVYQRNRNPDFLVECKLENKKKRRRKELNLCIQVLHTFQIG